MRRSTFATTFASFSLYELWKTCTYVQASSGSVSSDTWLSFVSFPCACRLSRPANFACAALSWEGCCNPGRNLKSSPMPRFGPNWERDVGARNGSHRQAFL